MSLPKVGINGFGRIGRILFRAGFEKLDICAINNPGDAAGLVHMLKYDSTHGKFPVPVEYQEGHLIIGSKKIPVLNFKNPAEIPWSKFGVDYVLECSGAFKKREDFDAHIKHGGAKKVIISAPADIADLTVVYGINHTSYQAGQHNVLSNASCTTNCLAPLAQVVHKNFGIVQGMMTTIHAYTNDQRVLDGFHSDLRRARTAAASMIPTTTGAAKAVSLVLPELKGKLDGTSVRVPTPNVSLVDLTFTSEKPMTKSTLHEAFKAASQGALKGILGCEEAPLVSIDYNGDTRSSVIDFGSTMVMGDKMAKVFSWYDNETGFSHRMVDLTLHVASQK